MLMVRKKHFDTLVEISSNKLNEKDMERQLFIPLSSLYPQLFLLRLLFILRRNFPSLFLLQISQHQLPINFPTLSLKHSLRTAQNLPNTPNNTLSPSNSPLS